ncbi:MAG: response regulator transcription factor [Syntrophales bacterium]|nr:response regulator transcription factor [Syntrophales bacterium]
MKRIRVLIADDHPIVREGFKKIITSNAEMIVEDEADSGTAVLNYLQHKKYDVVLLDISMPGRNGLDVLKDIKAKWPQLPVLMVSMYPEEQFAVRSFRAGASGYLNKTSAPTELISAIQKVAKGGRYISASLAEKLTYYLYPDAEKLPHETLSDREYQVMLMVASGMTSTDIARELSLSIKTISTYRTNIFEKMNMKNNVELTLYAIQNKLIG